MGATARVTVTVPADLRRRMGEVGEQVNWSAVASRAFQARLAEIITKRKVKDMRDVIARLKATADLYADEATTAGHEDGREWAELYATAEELRSLDRTFSAFHESEWNTFLDPSPDDAYSGRENLYFAIVPGQNGIREMAKDFWDTRPPMMAREHEGPEYLRGFVGGAMGLWDAVKDQV